MEKTHISIMTDIERCWEYAQSIPSLVQMAGIHGITHWRHVESSGLDMAKNNPEIDTTVVRLFACFHDFQRKNNCRDFEHGPNAAVALQPLRRTLLAFLTDRQFAQLTQACHEHTARTTPSGDITIDSCIDADRLDLGRVGITPDPAKMLTEQGAMRANNL